MHSRSLLSMMASRRSSQKALAVGPTSSRLCFGGNYCSSTTSTLAARPFSSSIWSSSSTTMFEDYHSSTIASPVGRRTFVTSSGMRLMPINTIEVRDFCYQCCCCSSIWNGCRIIPQRVLFCLSWQNLVLCPSNKEKICFPIIILSFFWKKVPSMGDSITE